MRKNDKPLGSADSVEALLPEFIEWWAERELGIYREMHALLARTKKRGKENSAFEALAQKSVNADALIAMHSMPGREAEIRKKVHQLMDELSKRGLPTPEVVLAFNREVSGTSKSAETDIEAKRALFYECLASDPECSDKRIAKLISEQFGKISRMTIAKWRAEPHTSRFISAAWVRRLRGGPKLFAAESAKLHPALERTIFFAELLRADTWLASNATEFFSDVLLEPEKST